LGREKSSMSKLLIVIVGPTASGKTALSVRLAQLFNTEIVSADSRQIYKELSIGTAKPSNEEMGGVVHHFINSHSIEEDYSIGKYERDTLVLLEKLFEKKEAVILTGGSGLYVKVVCEGMDEVPDSDPLLREELNLRYNESGIEVLLDELEKIDPEYYGQVDKSNPQRVIRALEVFWSTGTPFSQFRTGTKKVRPFSIIKVGLKWDRQELYDRIDQRMDEMIKAGLFEEVQSLISFKEKNALQTVGYKEIFDFLEGQYDKEEAIRLLKRNSRRYAKRQMTWFNKDKEVIWFHPREEEKIVEYIKSKL
jgi:tRNA dimethylallyltransferase